MNIINEDTINLIKEWEGCVLTAYPDPASKNDPAKKGKPWTIGYGHTGSMSLPVVAPGDVITQEQAEQYLRNDLNVAGAHVAQLIKVALTDNQFGALVSFYDNVGETTFKKSSVFAYVNAGKFNSVPGRLALYRYADGKIEPGLVRRRAAEGALWLKPDNEPVNQPKPIAIVEQNHTAGMTVQPDQNGKKKIDVGAIGGLATVVAALSGDVKTAIGNITDTIGVSPIWLLLIVGVGFASWTIYNRLKKEV